MLIIGKTLNDDPILGEMLGEFKDRLPMNIRERPYNYDLQINLWKPYKSKKSSENIIITGSRSGFVRFHPYEFNNNYPQEFLVNNYGITKLIISYDKRFIICGSDDGSIFIFVIVMDEAFDYKSNDVESVSLTSIESEENEVKED